MSDYENMTEIEKIRHIGKMSTFVTESFWDGMTRAEIFAIYDAWMESEWDFMPDEWAKWQVSAAKRGVVPKWDNNEKPVRA